MHIVDDPLLALIMRFVVDTDQSSVSNEQFLRFQLKAMQRHLEQFPEKKRGEMAMEWIEQHAKVYRVRWQRREASRRTFHPRCADCPFEAMGAAEHCEIHEQWLYLLRRYTSSEISSRDFVEHALVLLRGDKDRLRSSKRKMPRAGLQTPDGREKEGKSQRKGKKAGKTAGKRKRKNGKKEK
jgi:hypothetical protein